MVGEPHAVEVVGLALEPAGRAEHRRGRRHRRRLVGRDLDADALVVLEAEQIVDDVEALLALGPVDAADIHQLLEQAARIVAQEGQQRDQLVAASCRASARPGARRRRRPRRRSRLRDVLAELLQRLGHRTIVPSGGPSSGAAGCRRAAPRRSAGSPARRCRPARCGRSRARRNSCSGSSRRRWRRSPSRSRSAARPSGRRPCAAPAPSCWSACRPRSSRRPSAGSASARSRSGRGRSGSSSNGSSRRRSRRDRRSSPHRAGARPGDQLVELGHDEALVGQLVVQRARQRRLGGGVLVRVAGVVTPIPALPCAIRR